MGRPIVATPDQVIGPGIDALVALRPRALSHINYPITGGSYAKVFAGWRAQAALCLRRVADEVQATRIPFAAGDALRELAGDEYKTTLGTGPTTALGHVVLTRGGGRPGGAIRTGHRFRRNADDTQIPAVVSAVYTAQRDVPVLQGATSITVPIVAERAGAFANAPTINGSVQGALQSVDSLFDSTLAVASFSAAGGSDVTGDDELRAAAQAFSIGQYGPTKDAILAGALRGTGVARHAYFDVTQIISGTNQPPKNAAFASLVLADASWASSPEWLAQIAQAITGTNDADAFLGFGCVLAARGPSDNQTITVQPTVLLRDASLLVYTADIDQAIQKAVVAYFDERPDWYTWKASQLRAAITRADRRILACTSVIVNDQAAGTPLAEPASPAFTPTGPALTHFLVGDGAVSTTYSAPS